MTSAIVINSIAHLFKPYTPSDLILISRHPSKTPAEHTRAGVITRKANYDNPPSLQHAFDDVSCMLLVLYRVLKMSNALKYDLPTSSLFCFQPYRAYQWVGEKKERH